MSKYSGAVTGPLTAQASEYYKSGKFSQCLEALTKLSSQMNSGRGDPRLKHNTAIAEYCARNCTHSVKVMKRLTEIAQEAGYKPKKKSKRGDKEKPDLISTAKPGVPLLLYNQSVLLYQAKKYRSAIALLRTIFDNIQLVPEGTAIKVCFLLLELYVLAVRTCSSNSQKCSEYRTAAEPILAFLEKPNGKTEEGNPTKSAMEDPTSDEYRFRLHVAKTKWYLVNQDNKLAKAELRNAIELSKTLSDVDAQSFDGQHRDNIPLLKANELFQRASYPQCLQSLTSNYRNNLDQGVYLNNIGCVHFAMGHYSSASNFFRRATRANSSDLQKRNQIGVIKHRDRPFSTGDVPTNFLSEMMYNNGMALLKGGNFAQAFKCLQKAVVFLPSWPQLWLNLADCCIGFHKQQLKPRPLVAANASSNDTSVVILSTAVTELIRNPKVPAPSLTLGYAQQCLRNALVIAENSNSEKGAIIKQFALVKIAYVALTLESNFEALKAAKQVLELKGCRPDLRQLAQVYCLEACGKLDLQASAQRHSGINLSEVPKGVENRKCLAALCVNIANTHVLQKNLANAESFARHALRLDPDLNEALRLLTYIFMRRGETDAAIQTIRTKEAPSNGS